MTHDISSEQLAYLSNLFSRAVKYQAQTQFDLAQKYYEKVLELVPQHLDSIHYLGLVKYKQGQLSKAIELLKQAGSLAGDSNAEIFYNLGIVYKDNQEFQKAQESYLHALHINPRHLLAHCNLAILARRLNEAELSERHHRIACELNPIFSTCASDYLRMLSRLDDFPETNQFCKRLASLSSSLKPATEKENNFAARKVTSEDHIIPSLLNYDFKASAEKIAKIHFKWGSHATLLNCESLVNEKKSESQRLKQNKKLRIGYLSPDFREHAVARFIEPILECHDKNKFAIIAYFNREVEDPVTTRLKPFFDEWNSVKELDDNKLFDLIRNDVIDILVDLAGHTDGNRLMVFAKKPAPIQMTYLGYPNTTGLPTVDYRITDEITDPPGKTDQYYSESLLRLAGCFLCFRPESDCPPVSALPAYQNEYVTFGCFNNSMKINSDIVEAWSEILNALPSSRLILRAKVFSDERAKSLLLQQFDRCGVAQENIILTPYVATNYAALGLYNLVDISLDTFPYNGTTTTCESLWMGVPVITRAGNTHVSRVSMSILKALNLDAFVAYSKNEYIKNAIKLAHDLSRLAELRKSLRSRMRDSELTNGKRFTQKLEAEYLAVTKKPICN